MISLHYNMAKNVLVLTPRKGWTPETFDVAREDLICWKKRKKQLIAAPLWLAYYEAIETFPDIVEDEESIEAFKIEKGSERFYKIDNPNLYPIQVQPSSLLCQRSRALVTAAPGVGKTIMASVALDQRSPKLVFVVAPLSLVDNWRIELEAWFASELRATGLTVRFFICRSRGDFPQDSCSLGSTNIIISTPDTIRILYNKVILEETIGDNSDDDSILILDESFLYKNRKSQRSESIEELCHLFKHVWLLSGMPVAKFNDELYMQLHVLYPSVIQSYWKFANRYCFLKKTVWGTSIAGDKPNALDLLKRDLSDIMIECDFPEDIPDWEPEVISCRFGKEQEAIYTSLEDEMMVSAEVLGRETELTLSSLLTLTGRLIQVSSNPALIGGWNVSTKKDTLKELLKDYPLPALIWVSYVVTAEMLYDELSKLHWLQVGKLIGSTKSSERQKMVKDFQEGKLNVLIIHPGVGKYGHTLTSARTAFYLEKSWNSEEFYQGLFRARRITSTHPVKLVHLHAVHQNGSPAIDNLVYDKLMASSEKAQILTVGELIGTLRPDE